MCFKYLLLEQNNDHTLSLSLSRVDFSATEERFAEGENGSWIFAASSETSIETRIQPSLRHHANNFDRQTSSAGVSGFFLIGGHRDSRSFQPAVARGQNG